jgi:hypothetical protein
VSVTPWRRDAAEARRRYAQVVRRGEGPLTMLWHGRGDPHVRVTASVPWSVTTQLHRVDEHFRSRRQARLGAQPNG